MNRVLVYLGVIWAATLTDCLVSRNHNLDIVFLLAFGLHFVAKLGIALASGRRFHQDRQSGALELLLVTPLPMRDIVAGQREALWVQFRRALWLISFVNVLTLAAILADTIRGPGSMSVDTFIATQELFLGGAAMLWLDARALIWLGMWRGLRAKKYSRSVLATLGAVLFPPWLALLLFALGAGGFSNDAAMFLLVLWFGLGAAIDLAAIGFAGRKLRNSLRAIVSEGGDG
jgi:hypothetical protein